MYTHTHTHTSCIGLSESDSKLYANFEFCEEKNHKHLEKKNTLIYKAKQFMLKKGKFMKFYIF